MQYQSAQQTNFGYLDEEVSPGVFSVEVKQPISWWKLASKEDQVQTLKDHWTQRANELCPHGFQGTAELIMPSEARFERFYCQDKKCNKHPMVSGLAWCHKRYRL